LAVVRFLVVSQEAPGKLETVRLFVNSVDLEHREEELSSPSALASWLSSKDLGPVSKASAEDLEHAVELREALRELLLGHHGDYSVDPRAAGVVEEAARRARLEVRFSPDGVAAVAPGATGVDAALGRLLAIVAEAQADGTWARLKACPWETCRWAFYDHSKNRSGVWCNMAVCGNRAKARAYRERQARQRRPA
jgi:predicted RNA-binding Zn ribbon-like protein